MACRVKRIPQLRLRVTEAGNLSQRRPQLPAVRVPKPPPKAANCRQCVSQSRVFVISNCDFTLAAVGLGRKVKESQKRQKLT